MIPEGESLSTPDSSETSFVRLAEAYRREGLVDDAIRICRQGLARFPSSLRGRIVLGQSLLDRGAIGEAIVELGRVEREGYSDPEILELLCEVRLAGPLAWPVGAELARAGTGLTATQVEDREATPEERGEPPVLILDAADQPTADQTVPVSPSGDPLATPTLAGLYASQGDPGMADAILRKLTPEEAPQILLEEAPVADAGSAPYLGELTRWRRIAERLRKMRGRSLDRNA